jgi:3-methyladenine DNA glycosylase AlkD
MDRSLKSLIKELNNYKNPQKAKILQGFFKTGPGEYGEGDIFWGITVPAQRKIVKKYISLELKEIQKLLNSKIHEHRFSALVLLVSKYRQSNEKIKKQIFDFYLRNSAKINNWDLVDTSTPQIIGDYLLSHNKAILYKLAKSKNLWQRRIAVLATFSFIRTNDFTDILKISKILLKDKHDLIHKAVGWMLRETGKKNKKILIEFLKKYSAKMPRVMLRYAIEKLSQKEKIRFLKNK